VSVVPPLEGRRGNELDRTPMRNANALQQV
jgi:hypothetical protein